jgi:hypothetical protein
VSTRDRRRVTTNTAIVGDSITVLIQRGLQHGLGTRYNADVRARNGARIDEMLEPLRTALRNNPRDVVVNLGSSTSARTTRSRQRHVQLGSPASSHWSTRSPASAVSSS